MRFITSDNESPPLVQIFTSSACRLLFIVGENTQLMMMTVGKYCFVTESLVCQLVLLCSLYVLHFPWKGFEGITFRVTHVLVR